MARLIAENPSLREGQDSYVPSLSAGRSVETNEEYESQPCLPEGYKEPWKVSKGLVGHYVWATLDTSKDALSIAHRRSERAQPRLLKQYRYEIEEKVHKLKPEFHRRARKIDILKIS